MSDRNEIFNINYINTTISIPKEDNMTPKCPKCGGETKTYYNFTSGKLVGYDCHKCNIADVENYVGIDVAAEGADKTISYNVNNPIEELPVIPNPQLQDRIRVALIEGGLHNINYIKIDRNDNIDNIDNVHIDFNQDLILLEDSCHKVIFSSDISSMQTIDPATLAIGTHGLPTVFQIEHKKDNTVIFCYYNGKHVIKLIEYCK